MTALFGVVAAALWAVPAAAGTPPPGWSMCAPCHGETGAGDGPAADLLWPRPRDLRRAPLRMGGDRESIRATIERGVPGTPMPAFDLPPPTVEALVAHIVADRPPPDVRPVPPLPPPMPEERAAGERLWAARCAGCHGPEGQGDGPLAEGLRDADGAPADLFDLRRRPLKGGEGLAEIFRTLHRGRPGTPMAPFEGTPAEARALASRVLARRLTPIDRRWRVPPPDAPRRARDPWWGVRPLPDPGPAPAGSPALHADPAQCGVCHPRQHETWRQSHHARAGGPGLLGQYHGADRAFTGPCNACHAPLDRQQTDRQALRRGVTCAGCHVRAHRKHGPPGPSRVRVPAVGMAAEPDPRFARSDFCLPCHNLPLEVAVDGRPLLDTWREWAASPYLPAGVQCQHCHQPDGDHRVPGAHDAEMVRRAVRLVVEPPTIDGRHVAVRAAVHNVGAGHHFPTTATPRAVLRIRQLGPEGPLPQTARSWAIGRTVHHDGARWIEDADTRIPAGQTLRRRYRRPRHPDARRIEVSLHLFPDWFYARFYRARLKGELDPAARADFEAALAAAEASAILVDFAREALPVTEAR